MVCEEPQKHRMWLEQSLVPFCEAPKNAFYESRLLELAELRGQQGCFRQEIERRAFEPQLGAQVRLQKFDVGQEGHLNPVDEELLAPALGVAFFLCVIVVYDRESELFAL